MQKNTLTSPKKISSRQLMILFFFSAIACITRLSSPENAVNSSKSGWIAPILALAPILLLIFILAKIMKNREQSFGQIIEQIFGKIIGRIVLFSYFIHALFLCAYYLRNFGEKFIASIFPDISPYFFAIILLMFVCIVVRRNIEAFARFAEIAFILIIAGFIIAFFLAVFHAEPKNLYPVTQYDFPEIAKSSVPIIGSWSLITYSLFLWKNVTNQNQIVNYSYNKNYSKNATKFILFVALFNVLALILSIGIFNAQAAANMSMPYFMIFKSIKSAGLIRSFETFFIIFWAFTDFIAVAYYLFIGSKVFKDLFSIEKPKIYIFMFGFLILILSQLIGANNFECETFFNKILNPVGIILGFAMPFLVLFVGKIRRIL